MIHSTLYTCDICGGCYSSEHGGTGTGGICAWSWAGVAESLDLCPECLGRVRAGLNDLKSKFSGGDAQEPTS